MFKTHIVFGALFSLFLLPIISPENPLFFSFIIILASALPDIDHPNSKLGRKLRPISYLFEHRGFFHSFFALSIFTFIFYLLSNQFIYSLAFLVGYSSHLLLDSLTIAGISPLAPLSNFRLRGFLRCSSFYDYIVLFILMGIFVVKMGFQIKEYFNIF